MASASKSTGAKGLSLIDSAKRAAAYAAVDAYVRPDKKLIGIGSGSTVPYVVERIIAQGSEANSDRWFVPTGFQSKDLIVNGGLRLGDIDAFPTLDVTIDGADEIDSALNLIKGGGACQLREKVLAEAAKEFVVVADYRKRSKVLGEAWKQGVPVEVVPFGAKRVLRKLEQLGSTDAALRMGKAKAGPVVTDNCNFCIDAPFPAAQMRQPANLCAEIKKITGVVEVGLFPQICKAAYFGNEDGTISILKQDGSAEENIKPEE
ncbi:ribose-5-phosphate isomerase [Malassezia yamatoensis]|uniref:Ribose-5-phosphate isomerase n=1 Tax=Malassezia yamatoensis TaxID=253288 RepID=A0AAJ5YWN7_9BASI|nr:ribose-5-phosphate isomerase [Malassezia yamatoensis]